MGNSDPLIEAHELVQRSVQDQISDLDFIASLDRFRHRRSGILLKERTVLNVYHEKIPKRVSSAEALYSPLLGIRQYATLSFLPGEPCDVIVNGQVVLNTWIPPDIQPIDGDASPFLDFVDFFFDGNQDAANFFLDIFAFLIQKPGQKLAFMVLLIGGQGIGKSLLCEMVAELIGRKNTAFPSVDVIRGQFTGWLANAQLVVIHEMEKLARDTASRLKNWITADTLLINSKHVPEYSIRNAANIFACANHDDVAHLDPDDRRVFSWISQAQKRDPDFYGELCQWFYEGEGGGILLHNLLQRNISNFNPRAAPLRTESRAQLIVNSLSEAERFLLEALESYAPPFAADLCTARELLQYLREYHIRALDVEIRRFLHDHGVSLGQHRIHGARPCLWAIRNFEHWRAASAQDIAAGYISPFDQNSAVLDDYSDLEEAIDL